jgi:glucosamine-6-phosphate deaminase
MNNVEPIKTVKYDQLPVNIYRSNEELGQAAALDAREIINEAIDEKGEADIILATGNSQLIDPNHRASFPLFLRQHLLEAVNPRSFHPIPSQPEDVEKACQEYEALLREHPADLVALGFGENGHLAFNDPPYARFDDPMWVKVVELAEASRRQQVGEGHFDSLEEVPTQAITLTIPALLAAKVVLCIVPEARKAEAVRACLKEPISEDRPGSILRRVHHARLYLDQDSASKL